MAQTTSSDKSSQAAITQEEEVERLSSDGEEEREETPTRETNPFSEVDGDVETMPDFTPIYYADELPEPEGTAAKQIAKRDKGRQVVDAQHLYQVLKDPLGNKVLLNADKVIRTALISVPQTNMVRVVYGLSVKLGEFLRYRTKDDFLGLTGDCEDGTGTPTPIKLPSTAQELQAMKSMTHTQAMEMLKSKGQNYRWPLIKNKDVKTAVECMQIAPIPAYLVHDGFLRDLNAMDVYERILGMPKSVRKFEVMRHCRAFLRSCVQDHTSQANKPYMDMAIVFAQPSKDMRLWATSRTTELVPSITPTVATPPPQGTAPTVGTVFTAEDIANIIKAAIIASPTAGTNTTAVTTTHEEKKEDDTSLYGLSNTDIEMMLEKCGHDKDADRRLLPKWVRLVSEKKMSKEAKFRVIRQQLTENPAYDDAEIPLTIPLMETILGMKWLAKDDVNNPSYDGATEGLTPFMVMELNSDEVAAINADAQAMSQATVITVADLTKLGKANSRKARVPESGEDFLCLLKCFANLLTGIFGPSCPLFLAVKSVITALREYSKATRAAMSMNTKAAILWVTLLQCRKFALHELGIRHDFQHMQSCLSAKTRIEHVDVPMELVLNSSKGGAEKRKAELDISGAKEPAEKKGKLDPVAKEKDKQGEHDKKNPNVWHPKLKEKLEGPLQRAKYPSFSAILTYCGADKDELFSKNHDVCTPNTYFGRCHHKEKCKKKHIKPTDDQVTIILRATEKFIRDPEGIHKG